MSLVTAKSLREERARLAEQAKAILTKPDADKRGMTPEETVEFDALHAKMEELRVQFDRIEKQDTVEKELAESRGRHSVETGTKVLSADEAESRDKQHADAFNTYAIRGFEGLSAEQRSILSEYRAQSVGTTTAGGYLVPQGFSGELEAALKAYGGMRDASSIVQTASGNDLPWPTVNETANVGELLAENTGIAAQDATFGQVIFKAYKYSSKLVAVSMELLQDSAFSMDTILAPMLGTRIARITNTHFTTGTGTGQPNGVVTGAVVGKTGLVGQTLSVIFDDLVDLQHSVDPLYRKNATWMMHDTSLQVIKKIKDSQNRPLFVAGISVKEPDTILGQPYVINQDIAVMAANAKSILYGDFSKYQIRDVLGVSVRRLDERYAELGQVGFIAFMRTDGRTLNAGVNPIKWYANSAT